MLALFYLILVFLLGDAICKRFFPYVSTPHRFATAILAGLLISTWVTYLAAALFGGTGYPMLAGNVIFALLAIAGIILLYRFPGKKKPSTSIDRETTRFVRADRIVVGVFLFVAIVMMFGTFSMRDGNMRIANHQSSDFGSTASIMQSFAVGHNFPTEYPHFTGDRIRYHFLFYFQAGNLEYLGLSPATSNNLLSILTLLAMLTLVMTLGTVLFASRTVGRIGAILFFFHGSLAFIPFYLANGSLSAMWKKMATMNDFLSSGLPYRGEDWGVWSQVVYLNQRHLASSIGIFLIVVVFLAIRHRERTNLEEEKSEALRQKKIDRAAAKAATQASVLPVESASPEAEETINSEETVLDGQSKERLESSESSLKSNVGHEIVPLGTGNDSRRTDENEDVDKKLEAPALSPVENPEDAVEGEGPPDRLIETDDLAEDESPGKEMADAGPQSAVHTPAPTEWIPHLAPFVFAGVLLGLMPMWNGAVFAGAAGVLAIMFFVLPFRREMIAVAAASALIALPQVIFLKTGLAQPAGYSLWYFGYTVSDPTIYKVLYYLAFTFGFKWVLIGIALALATRLQRLMMVAFTALVVMATCFQFSEEVLANHKFFNVWLVLMNVPAAFGLLKLWHLIPGPGVIAGRVLAVVLVGLIAVGGIIDLFPIKNSFWVEYKFRGDPLVEWVLANTDPRSRFLSHRYVNHGILVAGRRLFYGHPYYAWGAGYPVGERDNIYRKMLESKNIGEVFQLLKSNNISYVAIDNLVRNGDFIKSSNEKLFEAYFPLVFDDVEKKYDSLKIYAVPETLGEPNKNVLLDATPTPSPAIVSNAFNGGEGSGSGQFSRPRGIATDRKGNIYVADTGNARIQKFDAVGNFLAAYGKPGNAEGELKEPNGIALDETGNIFITDASNHKLVKLDPKGQVLKEWKGPDPGFYGPRDMEFGPDKMLYIVDQGRTRIVKFDPATEAFRAWGTSGTGEGQFNESTGIAVGGGFIFVTDVGNNRIQVFDMDMNFARQWEIPAWEKYIWHYPDILYDDAKKLVYVTNGWKKEILAFDLNGNSLEGGLKPLGDGELNNPSSLCFAQADNKRSLLTLNTGGNKVSKFDLPAAK